MTPTKKETEKRSGSFTAAAIALVFLVLGFQTALFIYRAAVDSVVAHRDKPDTVFVLVGDGEGGDSSLSLRMTEGTAEGRDGAAEGRDGTAGRGKIVRKASHSPRAEEIYRNRAGRKVESFRFNPNTASEDELVRLGFSDKQARAILNYREKGGVFHRKSDFKKSYVVADSVYRRLEAFIDIPLLDLNKADSAALLSLPGIGPFYAGKIVSYRKELRGYSYPEQLLDLWKFDEEKLEGLRDLITVGPSAPFPLWTLPEDELASHPYISRSAAHGIVLYRENNPAEDCTVAKLVASGVLRGEDGARLGRCRIASP